MECADQWLKGDSYRRCSRSWGFCQWLDDSLCVWDRRLDSYSPHKCVMHMLMCWSVNRTANGQVDEGNLYRRVPESARAICFKIGELELSFSFELIIHSFELIIQSIIRSSFIELIIHWSSIQWSALLSLLSAHYFLSYTHNRIQSGDLGMRGRESSQECVGSKFIPCAVRAKHFVQCLPCLRTYVRCGLKNKQV